ncbi:MAG: sodium/proline symporter [Candidatus Puniceispirillum sp.]|nr:sodium/proline symporter [Candidatus Puniceispirillum sp.]
MTYFVFFAYFAILLCVGFYFSKRNQAADDFILGGRSLNYWVTALSAHASDMSAWLFMGFPAAVFAYGMGELWTAFSLVFFMFLSWQFVAPRIRVVTAKYNCLTLSSLFAVRFHPSTEARKSEPGVRLQMWSALVCIFFLIAYIASGLVGLGRMFESLFEVDYKAGVLVAASVIMIYTFLGGFIAVAWNDMLQAVFLLLMIIIVPVLAFQSLPGDFALASLFAEKESSTTLYSRTFQAFGWGLGYFGLPHVINKYMSIDHVDNIRKAKYVGLTWQALALGCAALIGLLGAQLLPDIKNSELLFVEMANRLLSPVMAQVVLCAVLAAALSTLDSQVMAAASTLAEDIFDVPKHKEMWLTRGSIIAICCMATGLAWSNTSSIYSLVFYAWAGLGCSFGPLVLWSLTNRAISENTALLALLTGAGVSALWPALPFAGDIPSMIPGFFLANLVLFLGSRKEIEGAGTQNA